MIALSCTQTGLSDAFREVFSFDGNEFYSASIEGTAGISFGELSYRTAAGELRARKPLHLLRLHEGRFL